MQASLQGKDNVIKQLQKQISHLQETHSEADRTLDFRALDSQITQLTAKVTALQAQNDLFRTENGKIKQHNKELYDSIKITRAKHIEQVTTLTNENVNLKAQTLNYVNSVSKDQVIPTVLTPGKHLKESVKTIHEIVEEAKVVRPLDSLIISACRYTKHSQELLEYAIGTCSQDSHQRDKKLDLAPLIRKNQVTFAEQCRTDRPLVFGLRLLKTYDGGALMAHEFREKVHRAVRFGNDHFGAIMGYRDYMISDSVISRHSCYVRDTDGVELIKGSRGSNLYTISVEDMMKSSPICLLSKAFKNKSWLWHRRLNHLNFGTINDLARKDLVRGLPRLKFEKDHLCFACQLGKSKKHTHKPKTENTNVKVLNTLHIDLCGPMRVQTINGKKHILVIIDDYSQFSWVKFLRSKDETPEVVIKFLQQIQVGLNKTVRYICTDNGIKFVNKALTEYYERIGIFYQKTVPMTPQQNGVVERRNCTLVEVARTMLIFSKASMFLKGYRIYNKRTRRIMETIHVQFDELTEPMAHVHLSTRPALIFLTPGHITIQVPVNSAGTPSSTIIDQDAPSPSISPSSSALQSPSLHQGVAAESTFIEDNPVAPVDNNPFINVFAPKPGSDASSSGDVSSTESTYVSQTLHYLSKWSKDHPLDNVIGNPSRPVSTRKQLTTDALWSLYNSVLSKVEPKNFKSAITKDCWFQAMQDEIHEFDRLQVWKLVPQPDCVMIVALKWIYKVKLDEYGDVLKNKARPSDTCLSSKEGFVWVKAGSSGVASPTKKHLEALKRVFRYLRGTINWGLWYLKDTAMALTAYANADHAGCQDTRRSTSGSTQFLSDKLVNWLSKKQKSTTISTTEAEYIAMSGFAIALCCNDVQHARSKHIDIRHHFIRDQVEKGMIELYFVTTDYQLANIFTKALPREQFEFLLPRLEEKSSVHPYNFSSMTLQKIIWISHGGLMLLENQSDSCFYKFDTQSTTTALSIENRSLIEEESIVQNL
nr:hypothetical protein [Tanacetum cinerariifolium]